MAERLPSLPLLLDLVQAERDKQVRHFDSLDGRAGSVLGFAGLLITFAPEAPAAFRVSGVLAAALSAVLALSSFWPRRFPLLEPSVLRRYVRAEEEFTRLTVLDTLESVVNEASEVLAVKGRRLRWSLIALAIAAGLYAAGIVVASI